MKFIIILCIIIIIMFTGFFLSLIPQVYCWWYGIDYNACEIEEWGYATVYFTEDIGDDFPTRLKKRITQKR